MTKGKVQNPATDNRIKDVQGYKSKASTQLFTLEDLFKHLLQDMYYAENKITKALPDMAKKATSSDLAKGFKAHLEETKDQISKIEKVFNMLGYQKKSEKCEAIEGLIKEAESLIEEAAEGATRDAALIAAAQKVEHYEIASYGTLCALANQLGFEEAGTILHDILKQEKDTDCKLSDLARNINEESAQKAA